MLVTIVLIMSFLPIVLTIRLLLQGVCLVPSGISLSPCLTWVPVCYFFCSPQTGQLLVIMIRCFGTCWFVLLLLLFSLSLFLFIFIYLSFSLSLFFLSFADLVFSSVFFFFFFCYVCGCLSYYFVTVTVIYLFGLSRVCWKVTGVLFVL